jgi:Leucine-rich repeat (LRR) protein
LDGLEYLRSLVCLVLDDNQLPGFYDGKLRALPNLTVLSAKNNLIQSVRGLEGLRNLKGLKELRLGGNPVCDTAEYAEFAKALPYVVV